MIRAPQSLLRRRRRHAPRPADAHQAAIVVEGKALLQAHANAVLRKLLQQQQTRSEMPQYVSVWLGSFQQRVARREWQGLQG